MSLIYCLAMSAMWGYILGNLSWYVYEMYLDGRNPIEELGRLVVDFVTRRKND